MTQVVIHLDDPNILIKTYKIRRTGYEGSSLETTIPRDLFEREARRLDLSSDEAIKLLRAVWRYGGFIGCYLSFEIIDDTGEEKCGI